ncbi:hypothetical protein BKA59DRAFT_506780 [Fusarium tricinctum]|jgi:hypothetical protein|uniref:Uncharacterized protein n=1 Tax=Fusarium tricinctum TaxID=61284 RepID=A0A8K0S777_9HYPO|nr:hypothetical protein BKA59DRAFT_506780 [Fusarium tricinctum]
MRFNITAIIAALASTAAADRMEVFTDCAAFGQCDSSGGTFYTDFGTYKVNANEGCRRTSVPAMTEFCMDWGNRRGHFRYSGQGNKRCLVQDSENTAACGSSGTDCYKTTWKEVACFWREIPIPAKKLATESPSSFFTSTTTVADIKTASN